MEFRYSEHYSRIFLTWAVKQEPGGKLTGWNCSASTGLGVREFPPWRRLGVAFSLCWTIASYDWVPSTTYGLCDWFIVASLTPPPPSPSLSPSPTPSSTGRWGECWQRLSNMAELRSPFTLVHPTTGNRPQTTLRVGFEHALFKHITRDLYGFPVVAPVKTRRACFPFAE